MHLRTYPTTRPTRHKGARANPSHRGQSKTHAQVPGQASMLSSGKGCSRRQLGEPGRCYGCKDLKDKPPGHWIQQLRREAQHPREGRGLSLANSGGRRATQGEGAAGRLEPKWPLSLCLSLSLSPHQPGLGLQGDSLDETPSNISLESIYIIYEFMLRERPLKCVL